MINMDVQIIISPSFTLALFGNCEPLIRHHVWWQHGRFSCGAGDQQPRSTGGALWCQQVALSGWQFCAVANAGEELIIPNPVH